MEVTAREAYRLSVNKRTREGRLGSKSKVFTRVERQVPIA